jgi:hypothetical protein
LTKRAAAIAAINFSRKENTSMKIKTNVKAGKGENPTINVGICSLAINTYFQRKGKQL